MEAEVLSSYCKQANNNIYNYMFQLECQICYNYYEGSNKEQTVATKANCGVDAQYCKIIPKDMECNLCQNYSVYLNK